MKTTSIHAGKIFLIFFTFALIFAITNFFIKDYYLGDIIPKVTLEENGPKKLLEREKVFKAFLQNAEYQLQSIRELPHFQSYLNEINSSQKDLENIFLAFVKSNPNFMQLRYIDQNGMEQIRVDRNTYQSSPTIIKKDSLQNKSHRYYFINSIEKPLEKVWYTQIDLNIEHKKVQVPHQPTFRVIYPVEHKEGFHGILIINYFMETFLNSFLRMPLYDSILMNYNGDILIHYDTKKNWSPFTDKNFNISQEYPQDYKRILFSKDLILSEKFVSKKLDLPIEGGLILLLRVNDIHLKNQGVLYQKHQMIILFTTLFFTLIISLIVIQLFKKLQTKLKITNIHNEELEQEVLEKNRLLKEKNKNLETALQQTKKANEAKSEFLANMSHEIRTPLNGIIGLNDILLSASPTKEQQDYLLKVKSSSKSLLNIINDILDYSKIEAGKLEIMHHEFNIYELIINVHNIFEYQIKAKGLNFFIKVDKDIPTYFIGDNLRITQVLNNLIGNSLKFTKKGSISINFFIKHQKHNTTTLQIDIQDTGIGIALSKQKKLFHPFEQGDSSTTKEYGGSGLGLIISKQLVELMGGKIWFESKENKGSTFSFTVQLENSANKKDLNILENSTQKTTLILQESKSALLVEDNKVNQIVAKKILSKLGFSVQIANNGEEAVKMAKETPFDIIFMDIQMPVLDGYEASKQIRTFNSDIPIIALSAAVMQKDKELALEAGMDHHLAKPIDKTKLIETISLYFKFVKN